MSKTLGRPTKFKPEYCRQARLLFFLGASDEQIADFFKVDIGVLAHWAWKNDEFYSAITPTIEEILEYKDKQKARCQARAKTRNPRMKQRRREEPSLRLQESMRSRIYAALKGKTKGRCLSRLGYSVQDLKEHLESRFKNGMSWHNYGKWHIDHIKPCSAFDHTLEEEFNKCWALENLQPLWAAENLSKGSKYEQN